LRSGDLNISEVIFKPESQFNYLFSLKNAHLSSYRLVRPIILERKQILQWNLQNMWSESSSLTLLISRKNLLQFQRYRTFSRGYFFLARLVVCKAYFKVRREK